MEPKRYWWESPLVLALEGTLAVHIVVAVAADALMITHPHVDPPPPPHITLVDIEVPHELPRPPPPPVAHDDPPPAAAPEPAPVPHRAQQVRATPPASTPPPTELPPSPAASADPGGAPVLAMPDLGPGTTGVAVATGPRTTGHIGRGGTGTGTGSGAGAGSAETPRPMSVATIKQRALPKGDYSYAQTKDYPAEAKQLGIEGQIRVKLVVDDHGKVASAILLDRLGHGLDEMALARARAIEFEPAKDSDDKPVSSVVVWTFDMTLPK